MVRPISRFAFLVLFALVASKAAAEPPDWTSLAGVAEIQVLSENPDGTPHETTVWLAVVDGEGFIRTGNTSWYPNLERKPQIGVRVEGKEYAVLAVPIDDESLRERVMAEYRAKYGWSDRFVGWLFPGHPHIVRLAPR